MRRIRFVRLAAVCLLLALVALAALAYALAGDLPAPEQLIVRAAPDSTKIYDRQGNLLAEVLDPRGGRRTRVPLEQLPLHFRQAVIAVEDANFYVHPGVDPIGVSRAVMHLVLEGELVSGGSTITQQLARELAFAPGERLARTPQRKLREMFLALRLSQAYSKDTILEMYLNEVYFGSLAYGAEAAARTYFGKGAHELDLAESALLAGLLQAPSAYDPLTNLRAARQRQQIALGLMVKHGYIDQAQADAAYAEPLHFAAPNLAARAPHFALYVRDQLEAQFGAERVQHGALRVYTTLDGDLQARAEGIVAARLADLERRTREGGEPDYHVTNAAVVVLEPASGEIRAMVGSAAPGDPRIDGAVNVALAERQPGSSLKPIVYAAAFQRGYGPATVLSDVPTSFTTREGEPYQPQNFDREYHGPLSLRSALATSSNLIAVKVLNHAGLDATLALARALGITSFDDPERIGLSLALGGSEVRLLDLTAAYAAFANDGRRVSPQTIRHVTDAAGTVLFDAAAERAEQPQVIPPAIAYLVTHILSDDAARIPAFGEDSVLHLTRPAAAKTGTTTNFHDNWTLGYTPDLAVGVWAGNSDNTPMVRVTGITGAGPIWHDVMEAAHAGLPARAFARPPGIAEIEICETSGLLATDLCPRRRFELFLTGSEPLRADDSYVRAEVDSATGLLWSAGCRGERIAQVFRVLPPDARAWGQAQGIPQLPDATCDAPLARRAPASTSDESPLVLISPAPNSTFAITSQLPSDAQRIELAARIGSAHGVRAVTLLVDGRAVGTRTEMPYRVLWEAAPGEHILQAVGLDADGHQIASPPLTFRVLPAE